jgi:hypothetical protein
MSKRIALAALVLLGLNACSEECVVEACEDFERPQAKGAIETGIVGVVAYTTDACQNDCCECTYTQARLLVFETDTATEDATEVQARFADAPPLHTLEIDTRYTQALEPGRYAACDQQLRTCANLEIAAGEVFTLNVKTLRGPMQMRVFDDSGTRQRDLVVGAGAPY